jgi:hypothetical protein
MDEHCEHADGSYMGKCAICDNMVCGECFQTIFNTMICGEHGELEDESAWELVGFYTGNASVEERRYYLQEQSVTSIVVETDDDLIELYVPIEEKEEAFAALAGASEDTLQCDGCRVFFSKEIGTCPICGVRQLEEDS